MRHRYPYEDLRGERKIFTVWFVTKDGCHHVENFDDANTAADRCNMLLDGGNIERLNGSYRCQVSVNWEHKGWTFPKWLLPPECYDVENFDPRDFN